MVNKKKLPQKNLIYICNVIGLVMLVLVGGAYLFQVNSKAGLAYEVEQTKAKISQLENQYQTMGFSNKFSSLENIRRESEKLNMVDVSSPFYVVEAEREFARRR